MSHKKRRVWKTRLKLTTENVWVNTFPTPYVILNETLYKVNTHLLTNTFSNIIILSVVVQERKPVLDSVETALSVFKLAISAV